MYSNWFVACLNSSDVLFIIDSGASVGSINFRQATDFAISVTQDLSLDNGDGKGCRISFIQFSSSAFVRFRLNDFIGKQSQMLAAFTQPFTGGTHNAAEALGFVI